MEDYDGLIEDRKPLLAFHRTQIERLEQMDGVIVQQLIADPMLKERVQRLKSIEGVGDITAFTWVVEVGEPSRFPNERHAISYCGLCAAERESAGVTHRGPLSKQRNHFLQTTLIEAAHLAVRFNSDQLGATCRPRRTAAGWKRQVFLVGAGSAVSLAVMEDAADLDGAVGGVDEQEPELLGVMKTEARWQDLDKINYRWMWVVGLRSSPIGILAAYLFDARIA